MKSIIAKMLGVSRGLLEWLLVILADQAGRSLEKLLPVALGIVTELATSGGMGNAEKRAAAISRLGQAARDEGISAGASVLNLAVEMAVAKMKAEAGLK